MFIEKIHILIILTHLHLCKVRVSSVTNNGVSMYTQQLQTGHIHVLILLHLCRDCPETTEILSTTTPTVITTAEKNLN